MSETPIGANSAPIANAPSGSKRIVPAPEILKAIVDPENDNIIDPTCLLCLTEGGCEWAEICESEIVCVGPYRYYTWKPKGLIDDSYDALDPGCQFPLACSHDKIGPRIRVEDLIKILSNAAPSVLESFLQALVDAGLIDVLIDNGLIQALIDAGLIQALIDAGLIQALIDAGLISEILQLIDGNPAFCAAVEGCVIGLLPQIINAVLTDPLFCHFVRKCFDAATYNSDVDPDPTGQPCSTSHLIDSVTGCVTHVCIDGVAVCVGSPEAIEEIPGVEIADDLVIMCGSKLHRASTPDEYVEQSGLDTFTENTVTLPVDNFPVGGGQRCFGYLKVTIQPGVQSFDIDYNYASGGTTVYGAIHPVGSTVGQGMAVNATIAGANVAPGFTTASPSGGDFTSWTLVPQPTGTINVIGPFTEEVCLWITFNNITAFEAPTVNNLVQV